MKTSAIIIAAAIGSVAAPAFAGFIGDANTAKAVYDAKQDKYCISQQVTGRLLPMRDCRTKEEWAATGAKVGEQTAKKAHDTFAQK